MKVIFLDNDGVICLSNNWGGRYKKRKKLENKQGFKLEHPLPVDLRFDNFDKKAIAILNSILDETGAEIVVSSDWKLHADLQELGEYYEQQKIIKRPIATTPNMKDFDPSSASLFSWKGWLERARIVEIKKYLEDHPEVEKWVAIDDLLMGKDSHPEGGLDYFVACTRSSEGIKQSGIKEKVISILNS